MRPRDRAALALVALTLAFAALAIGGAPRWAACIASLLAIASAIPYVTSRRSSSRPSPLLVPIVVALGLTVIQLVPLPAFVAELIAPAKLELVRENAAAIGDPEPRWILASYDPPATLVELAKLTGYLALGYTCVRLATIRRARTALAAIVVGVATTTALVTLAHHVAGARDVYGLYHPRAEPTLLGPLLSPNHQASLFTLAVPLALALALAAGNTARIGWLAAAAVLSGTAWLGGSRGGVIGLVAGLVVTIAILVVQKRGGTDEGGRKISMGVAVPGAVVAVCAVVLLAIVTAGDVARDLESTSIDEVHEEHSKFQLWMRGEELVPPNRWIGVGHGAFEPAFTAVAETGGVTYSHVEDGYLQAAIDFGVPGALLLLVAFVGAARHALKRWRHGPVEAGAIGAIAVLAVHDIADFSIELPAVAMTIVVIGAILCPSRLGTATDDLGKRARSAPRDLIGIRAGAVAAALALVALALSPLGRTARADSDDAAAQPEGDARLAAARRALERHPSDYVAAGQVADALFAERDPRAVKMIARALAMNPNHSGLHHLAARMLSVSQHPEQAAVEFAAAARWARDPSNVVSDVLEVFHTPEQIAASLPAEPQQAWRILHALAARPDAAAAYAQRVAEAYPHDAEMQAVLAYSALAVGHADVAVRAARAANDQTPSARYANLLAKALAMSGDRAGAIAALVDAGPKTTASPVADRVEMLLTLADLQVQVGALDAAASTLDGAERLADLRSDLRATIHSKAAEVQDRMGNTNQAEWERRQARSLTTP